MAREDRQTLEEIAVDMVAFSMQYMDTTRDAIREEVAKLTDADLVAFITE